MGESSINGQFSMAMLNKKRVCFFVLATLEMSPQPGPARKNHSPLWQKCVWMPVSVSSIDLDLELLAAGLASWVSVIFLNGDVSWNSKHKTTKMLVHTLGANERCLCRWHPFVISFQHCHNNHFKTGDWRRLGINRHGKMCGVRIPSCNNRGGLQRHQDAWICFLSRKLWWRFGS